MSDEGLFGAIVGGPMVILSNFVVHALTRWSAGGDRTEAAKDRITLALELVNWLQIDQQIVIQHAGKLAPPMQANHPVYALAAQIRRSQPKLVAIATQLLADFQRYYQATRVLGPPVGATAIQAHVDNVGAVVNSMTASLNKVIEAVCPPAE